MPPKKKKRAWRGLYTAALVLIAVVAYDPTRFENTSGDNISARYWPIAVLKHDTLKLNFVSKDLDGVAYAAVFEGNGDWLTRTELGVLGFTLPFYWLCDVLDLGGTEWTHDRFSYVSRWNGIAIASISLVILFFLLCKFVPEPVAFASSLLFALGSYSWTVGGQGISTQVCGVFIHLVSLHILWHLCTETDPKKLDWWTIAFGLICGLGWSTRPSTLFMVVAPMLLLRTPKRILLFAAAMLAVVLPVIEYNEAFYRDIFGWRGVIAKLTAGSTTGFLMQGNVFKGLPGILFSPNRGAIVFLPILLMVPYFWYRLMPKIEFARIFAELKSLRLPAWRSKMRNGVPENFSNTLALSGSAYLIATSQLGDWHSTWAYGPRYLYDLQPYVWPAITLGIFEVWKWAHHQKTQLPRWAMALLVTCALEGVFIHALGHRNFDIYVWDIDAEVNNERAWRFDDLMIPKVWNAGSNHDRWHDALGRLKTYGF